jgi:hypothetical protein
MCTVASCSLCSCTSRGVLRVKFSVISTISCLYLSMVSVICWIFTYIITSCSCTQSGILMYTSMSFFSRLLICLFSSSFYNMIFSHFTFRISFTSWSIAILVAFSLARACKSYIILSCSRYKDFMGIFFMNNSICYTSFTCLSVVYSCICNMSHATVNMSLLTAPIFMVSTCSFCVDVSYSFSSCCVAE